MWGGTHFPRRSAKALLEAGSVLDWLFRPPIFVLQTSQESYKHHYQLHFAGFSNIRHFNGEAERVAGLPKSQVYDGQMREVQNYKERRAGSLQILRLLRWRIWSPLLLAKRVHLQAQLHVVLRWIRPGVSLGFCKPAFPRFENWAKSQFPHFRLHLLIYADNPHYSPEHKAALLVRFLSLSVSCTNNI